MRGIAYKRKYSPNRDDDGRFNDGFDEIRLERAAKRREKRNEKRLLDKVYQKHTQTKKVK